MLRKKFLQIGSQLVLGTLLYQSCKAPSDQNSSSKELILTTDQRIGFFGDSITNDGRYIDHLEAKVKADNKYKEVSFGHYGKSSETVSGLSEPIHDPVRPLLFDRLQTVYNESKPNLLFLWYGINDAIYHPFSEDRFTAYKIGVQRFLDFGNYKKANVVLMTPGPFGISDEAKAKLLEKESSDFSWMNPYPEYNEVMRQYRDYILSIDHPSILRKIDLYTPLNKQKKIAFNEDPIHPNDEGHRIIAEEIYAALY